METESSEISQGRLMDTDSSSNTEMDSNTFACGNETNQEYNLAKETNKMDDNVVKEDSNQYSEKDIEKQLIASSMYHMPFNILSNSLRIKHNEPNYLPCESLVIYYRQYRDMKAKKREVDLVFNELYGRTQLLIGKLLKKWIFKNNKTNIDRDNFLQIVDDASFVFYNSLIGIEDFLEKNYFRCIICMVSTTLRKHKRLFESNVITIEGIEKTKDVKSIMKSSNIDISLYLNELFTKISQEIPTTQFQVYCLQYQGSSAQEIATMLSIPVNQVNNHLKQARKKAKELINNHYQDED